MGLAPPESDAPNEAANEDFLFHLYRGSELLQDNRAHEAKEELERALHLQPHDTKGQDLLAVVYFRLGLYPRAISIYEQLRRTSPRDPALLLNLALCYLKTGQAALARRDLEQLLTVNPTHARAWGYLGLACERVGALDDAQRAFEHGGHGQMARRIADRRASQAPPPPMPDESSPSREVREVVAAAFEELDAGELSFALAEPASDSSEQKDRQSGDSWRPVELGQMARIRPEGVPSSRSSGEHRPLTESKKPDTKDGPPPPAHVAPIPQMGSPTSMGRRPTLMVGVPPPHDPAELEALSRLPSPRPPSFIMDEQGMPSLARPGAVVVPAPRGTHASVAASDGGNWTELPPSKRTLPPPSLPPPSRPPAPAVAAAPAPAPAPAHSPSAQAPPSFSAPSIAIAAHLHSQSPEHMRVVTAPPPAAELTRASIIEFPASGSVVLHPSGVALVRTAPATGFAARLEALRASSNALSMKLLERQVKGKSTGESFGGVGSPLVHALGDGQLVLAPRPGRKLSSFMLEGDPAAPPPSTNRNVQDDHMCFVREEVLLGFDGALIFENGRLATGEGEFVAVVQLRGRGAVVLEAIGEVLTLEVNGNRGISVRREVVLGWFGRLVPRALPPSEAPCGQRGLVSFAGEGRVLVASA